MSGPLKGVRYTEGQLCRDGDCPRLSLLTGKRKTDAWATAVRMRFPEILGLAGAFALANVMATLVFGVSPRDLATFSIVPCLVLVSILIGCYIPARRAAKVDPMVALRYE